MPSNPAPPRSIALEALRFRAASPLDVPLATAGGTAVRTFAGVAYSGRIIKSHYFWGDVIFDLDTMQVPAKFAALVNHDSSSRAGFVTAHQISPEAGLTVQGTLLTNGDGQRVAADSDGGFPWQMSVHIEPGSVDELGEGTTAVVNGLPRTGPLKIFRNARIREVSFCAVGYDSNTSASAFSFPQPATTPQESPPMSQELTAQIAALQTENAAVKAERDTALAASAAAIKASRSQELQTVFSKLGLPTDEADLAPFVGMEATAYAATVNSFSKTAQTLADATAGAKAKPELNPALFSHQAAAGAAPAIVTNPLMPNAQARADKFAKPGYASR